MVPHLRGVIKKAVGTEAPSKMECCNCSLHTVYQKWGCSLMKPSSKKYSFWYWRAARMVGEFDVQQAVPQAYTQNGQEEEVLAISSAMQFESFITRQAGRPQKLDQWDRVFTFTSSMHGKLSR